jgi:hypothetical protein
MFLTLIPIRGIAQLPFGSIKINADGAKRMWEKEETPLTTIDFSKDVGIDAMLENYLTLSDVWSYVYTHRGEGEKLVKDAFLAFKTEKNYDEWRGLFPKSTSLLVAWYENETWSFAGIYAQYYLDGETGDVAVDWHFNEWEKMHYNIYVMKDWFLNHFIPIAARAPRGEEAYEQLDSTLRTGVKDNEFVIYLSWRGIDWKVPIILVLAALGIWKGKKGKKS